VELTVIPLIWTGTLVDATIIASASEADGEAHWVKHKGKPARHGFKAHVGADAETALVEEIAVTPANVNDGMAGRDRSRHRHGQRAEPGLARHRRPSLGGESNRRQR
jgi:hypothetical protein